MRHTLAFMLCALSQVGCALESPVQIQVITHDDSDNMEFVLETVTVETATDLFTGKGQNFDLRGDLKLNLDLLFNSNLGDIESADEMIATARTNEGGIVYPSLSYDPIGGQYVADDFDSLNYLTTFYNFEIAWNYFDNVIGDESGATSDFGFIGFYGTIVLSSLVPVPFPGVPVTDNALFYTLADAWLTLPVHDQDGIPLSMNDAVIVHEFQHRIFFKNVVDGPAFPYWFDQFRDATAEENQQTPPGEEEETTAVTGSGLSLVFFKGVDEGLADIFAVGLHGNPQFMEASLKDAPFALPKFYTEGPRRDLEGQFADQATYDGLLYDGSDDCGGRITDSSFNHYCLGTVLARTLWETADRDGTILRDKLLPAVNRSLSETGNQIADRSAAAGAFNFEVNYLLEEIAQELVGGGLLDDFCLETETRFTSLVESGLVPTCG
jgi:hypothetical protein